MCEITEDESLTRRLDSLTAENERFRGANAILRLENERLRSEAATLGRRFDAACEIADQFKAERDAILEYCLVQDGTPDTEDGPPENPETWWMTILDAYTKHTTKAEALAATRVIVGLDAAPLGEKGGAS